VIYCFKLDIEEKIKSWTPKPLVDTEYSTAPTTANYVIEGKVVKHFLRKCSISSITFIGKTVRFFNQAGSHVVINNRSCINFATHNYYNFFSDKSIENGVVDAVNKYGIGSCGPRAFYGTFGKYLDFVLNRSQQLAYYPLLSRTKSQTVKILLFGKWKRRVSILRILWTSYRQ